MKLAAPRAILFDLDGTFVDTAPDMAHALNRLRAMDNLPPLDVPTVRPHVSRGARGMLAVGFGISADDAAFTHKKEAFLALYAERLCVDSALFDGIQTVVDLLETRGLAWGIVTNKATAYAAPIARALGFDTRAGCFVCGDTTAHTKPHPAPLLHAANLINIAPTDCWYVGDDERDMQAAKAAGMRAIVAGYGYLGGTPHTAWEADAVVSAPRALLELL